VSSTYRVLCLSHDPAIIVTDEWEPLEWNNEDEPIAAVAKRLGSLASHAKCDLMVGAYSTPLVQVACPPNEKHWHKEPVWMDANWLKLMAAAMIEPNDAVNTVLDRFHGCWNPERVRRLRVLLSVEEA
jgi:hypothetical protein